MAPIRLPSPTRRWASSSQLSPLPQTGEGAALKALLDEGVGSRATIVCACLPSRLAPISEARVGPGDAIIHSLNEITCSRAAGFSRRLVADCAQDRAQRRAGSGAAARPASANPARAGSAGRRTTRKWRRKRLKRLDLDSEMAPAPFPHMALRSRSALDGFVSCCEKGPSCQDLGPIGVEQCG